MVASSDDVDTLIIFVGVYEYIHTYTYVGAYNHCNSFRRLLEKDSLIKMNCVVYLLSICVSVCSYICMYMFVLLLHLYRVNICRRKRMRSFTFQLTWNGSKTQKAAARVECD